MDKQEYKILSEEITSLIASEQFVEAAEIADRIDWRKVRSFTTLQRISDLYKINRRYEDALDIMLMAYDRNPGSRTIIYGLCELYLELNDLVSALKYLSLYKKVAPKDTGVYILQYKVLELENASLEDRIELLEELNRKDYREEWAYQLAYLYHRIGFATKCVEACDQLITWFGDGPFVIKAMELKMLHQPLTEAQQQVYEHRNDIEEQIKAYESDEYSAEKPEPGVMPEIGDEDFHVKTIDMGKFNTINLQKALAESMRELMGEEYGEPAEESENYASDEEILAQEPVYEEEYPAEEYYEEGYYEESEYVEEENAPETYEEQEVYEEVIEEGYYEEEYGQEPIYEEDFEEGYEEAATEYIEKPEISEQEESMGETGEIFFEDKTGDIIMDQPPLGMNPDMLSLYDEPIGSVMEEKTMTQELTEVRRAAARETATKVADEGVKTAVKTTVGASSAAAVTTGAKVAGTVGAATSVTGKSVFDHVLSLDNDGQISLVVPEQMIEKQITGQMNLEDVLAEWENLRQKKERQQQEEVRRSIFERTGKIFEDYDESNRTGLLAQLEKEQKLISKKYRENDIELRKVEEIEKEEPIKEAKPEFEDLTQKTFTNIPTIWAEVDAATLADKNLEQEEEKDEVTEQEPVISDVASGVAAGAVVAGGVATAVTAVAAGAGTAAGVAASVSAAGTEAVEAASAGVAGMAAGVTSDLTSGNVIKEDAIQEDNSREEPWMEEEVYEEAYEEAEPEEVYEEAYEETELVEEYQEEEPESEEYYEEEYYEEEYYEEEEVSQLGQAVAKAMADEEEFFTEESQADETEYVEEILEQPGDEIYDDALESDDEIDNPNEAETTATVETNDVVETTLDTAQIDDIGSALEAAADKVGVETVEEINENNEVYDEEDERDFSMDELELFSDFMYSKKMRRQILEAIDLISLESYVGNVIITGDSGTGVIELAKDIIKEIQMIDNNFAANKVAKISGSKMNRKNIASMFTQLSNGALIIEKAGELTKDTLENMTKVLETNQEGIIVIMTDSKKEIENLIRSYEVITGYFNARIDITPMNDNALVEYAKKYAYSQEYKIDEERAVLALHQRISELQIGDHHVTTKEVEELVDEAIEHSKRPRISTYFDILMAKRYDYEDMIILREKDFDN